MVMTAISNKKQLSSTLLMEIVRLAQRICSAGARERHCQEISQYCTNCNELWRHCILTSDYFGCIRRSWGRRPPRLNLTLRVLQVFDLFCPCTA